MSGNRHRGRDRGGADLRASMEPLTCVSGNRNEEGHYALGYAASMEPLTCVSGNGAERVH